MDYSGSAGGSSAPTNVPLITGGTLSVVNYLADNAYGLYIPVAVPEPSGVVLCIAGTAMLLNRRKRS